MKVPTGEKSNTNDTSYQERMLMKYLKTQRYTAMRIPTGPQKPPPIYSPAKHQTGRC